MGVNDTKHSLKMRSKGWLSIKNVLWNAKKSKCFTNKYWLMFYNTQNSFKIKSFNFLCKYKTLQKLVFQAITGSWVDFKWAELFILSNIFESIRNCFRLESLVFSGKRKTVFFILRCYPRMRENIKNCFYFWEI